MACSTVFSGDNPWRTFFLAPFEATFANSVLTGPGHNAVTEMPRDFTSAAKATLKLSTKLLLAPYTAKFPRGKKEARHDRR